MTETMTTGPGDRAARAEALHAAALAQAAEGRKALTAYHRELATTRKHNPTLHDRATRCYSQSLTLAHAAIAARMSP